MVITVLVLLALVFLFVGLARITNGLISHACGDCTCPCPWPTPLSGIVPALRALLWSARPDAKDPEEPRT